MLITFAQCAQNALVRGNISLPLRTRGREFDRETEDHVRGLLLLQLHQLTKWYNGSQANPLGFVIELAGGLAVNGTERVLHVEPEHVHQRSPVFLGSWGDVKELQVWAHKRLYLSFGAQRNRVSKL